MTDLLVLRTCFLLGLPLLFGCKDVSGPEVADAPGQLIVIAEPAATKVEVIAWGQQEVATVSPARTEVQVVIKRKDEPFACSVFGYVRVTLEDGRVGVAHLERPIPPPDRYTEFYCTLDLGEILPMRIAESDLDFGDIPWPPAWR